MFLLFSDDGSVTRFLLVLEEGDQYTGPSMTTHSNDDQLDTGSNANYWAVSSWKQFCRLVVRIFYRCFEVSGAASIPADSGLILCANHVNALVDAVVMQAATVRLVRPLARSGLFSNPLLRPLLHLIGAAPVYRRQDPDSNTAVLRPISGETGIITGNSSSDPWFSPVIPGDDDGKVSVECAKLDEMHDFLVVENGHTFIMRDTGVIHQILCFLKNGFFDRPTPESR